ncbi:unnamed protein product [Bursaphelenchus okinawaensis]|uniref:Uncharacterized protein n=1 Tax=Bursaphelenchus okinawaensis TaxID=465554 RepID=A0A811K5R2_9BILA|nr:unnamed protein product [Bursaphelenchus okinawaensis]CAG9091905.1 unnamed protein product [Bursaphelenchus okinawaensis]
MPASRFENELQKVFNKSKQCFQRKLLAESSSKIGKKLNSTVHLDDITVTEGSAILLDCLPKNSKSIVLINNLRQYSYGPPSECAKNFGKAYQSKADSRVKREDVKTAFFNGQVDVCSLIINVMNPFYCDFKKACPNDIQDFQVTYAALYSIQQLLLKTEKPLVCMRHHNTNEPLGEVINPKAYEKTFNINNDTLIVNDDICDVVVEGSGADLEEGSGIGAFQSDASHLSEVQLEDQFWEELRIERVLNDAFN